MPHPKRATEGASIHIVISRDLKEWMERKFKQVGEGPGAWQRFIESVIRRLKDGSDI